MKKFSAIAPTLSLCLAASPNKLALLVVLSAFPATGSASGFERVADNSALDFARLGAYPVDKHAGGDFGYFFKKVGSAASDKEPILNQNAGLSFALLSYRVLECDQEGNAGAVNFLFGAPKREFYKSLARLTKTDGTDFEAPYGPYKTYREYVEAVGALKKTFLDYFSKSGFKILSALSQGELSGRIFERDDPWTIAFRNRHVNPLIHGFAKQVEWPEYTTIAFARFEKESGECKNEHDKFEAKLLIKENR